MAYKVRDQKDLAAGALYIVVGCAFAVGALEYRMGTAARMGPGYLPFWLGVMLAAIGLVVTLKALRPSETPTRIERWGFRALVLILGPVALFGVLLQPIGLFLSIIVLVALSSLATQAVGWKTTMVSMLVLAGFSVLLFVYGLGLPLPVWPTWRPV